MSFHHTLCQLFARRAINQNKPLREGVFNFKCLVGNVETGYDGQMNVEVKPSRLLDECFNYRGRCPRLPISASRRVLPSRQGLALNLGHSTLGSNV